MKIHRRRVLAALGTVVAVAAGMATATPGAVAAEPVTWQAADGKLTFVNGARNVIQTQDPGSNTYTDFLADARQPAWSPDGSRVAYVKNNRIETRRYTGSTLVKIQEQGSMSSVGHPTFLRSGNTVVYSGGGLLRYASSDGSRYAQPLFSTTEDGCDRQPSASVNGLVAFVRTGDTCGSPTGSAIWLWEDTNGGFTKLADSGTNPAISPDGTQVAFVREADGQSRLFVVNTDGTGERQLTFTDAAYAPAWAPTGNRIVVTNGTDEDVAIPRIVDVATGEVTKVALPPGTSSALDPAWQPLRSQSVGRVWGADSYATNVAASRWTWNTTGQSEPGLIDAKTAVLISKDSPSYALTGQTLMRPEAGPPADDVEDLGVGRRAERAEARAEARRHGLPGGRHGHPVQRGGDQGQLARLHTEAAVGHLALLHLRGGRQGGHEPPRSTCSSPPAPTTTRRSRPPRRPAPSVRAARARSSSTRATSCRRR